MQVSIIVHVCLCVCYTRASLSFVNNLKLHGSHSLPQSKARVIKLPYCCHMIPPRGKSLSRETSTGHIPGM